MAMIMTDLTVSPHDGMLVLSLFTISKYLAMPGQLGFSISYTFQ